jgi:site-specific recombinase XerD
MGEGEMMASQQRRRRWQDVDKSQLRVADLVGSFLTHQEDRNHSPKTVRWYRDMLGRFLAFAGEDTRLRELTPDAVRSYQHSVQATDTSKFTRHAYMRTLKTFVRWLEREEYIEPRLAHRIEMPKVPRYDDVTIDVLSDDEITRLLHVLEPTTDVGSRNRAIVCLMLECGLRLDEVVSLQVNDVRVKDMYLRVHGKGDKESYVPIGPTTQKALARYSEHFRIPASPAQLAFFLNIYGEPLGYEAVKSTFDRLAKASGISRLHPHLLRHTAATRMLANGADIHSVQRLLRHSDIRTTLRYAHLAPDQLQEKMRLFSPMTRLGQSRHRTYRN